MVVETPNALVRKKRKPHGNRSKADCDLKVQVSLDNAGIVIDDNAGTVIDALRPDTSVCKISAAKIPAFMAPGLSIVKVIMNTPGGLRTLIAERCWRAPWSPPAQH